MKTCSRCLTALPVTSFGVRRASPDGLQKYCRACVSAWAREHRPRKLKDPPPLTPGNKWCRRCETVKPLGAFAANRAAADGLQGQCRVCAATAYRAKRVAAGAVVAPLAVPDGHKFCRSCGTTKPNSEWSTNRRASDGLQTRCKVCASAAARRDHLRTAYGLSLAEREEMLLAQQGVCAICLTEPAAHVDHDHVTGAIRGLLCFRCNAALGQFGDNAVTLRRAADYLERTGTTPETPTSVTDIRATLAGSTQPSRLEWALRGRLDDFHHGAAS